MKNLIILIIFFTASISYGQFREELNKPKDVKSGIINNNPSSFLLGFINPANFTMNHSFSMSYSSFGSNGIALGVYTNSIGYKFNDKLNIQIDASIVNSPYSTFGSDYSQQINGIYLSRAQLNYKPSENTSITIQYRQLPYNYNYRYSPFWGSGFLGGQFFRD
jgi:hypothetical protein